MARAGPRTAALGNHNNPSVPCAVGVQVIHLGLKLYLWVVGRAREGGGVMRRSPIRLGVTVLGGWWRVCAPKISPPSPLHWLSSPLYYTGVSIPIVPSSSIWRMDSAAGFGLC
jgi:hypothetical protein